MAKWWFLRGGQCEESKQFFFEKKNQKTFVPWVFDSGHSATAVTKAFCFFFSKKKRLLPFWGVPMTANTLLTFYRSLSRHKLFAALNVLGLATGIAVCLTLMLIVRYEFGFDRWLPGASETYRVDETWSLPGEAPAEDSDVTFLALHLLRQDFPQIKAGTRLWDPSGTVSAGSTIGSEILAYVDSGFFNVFRLPFVAGDKSHALLPGSVVMTESMARKYFGTTRAIGRTLQIKRDGKPASYTVSAVIADLPRDSTLDLGIILSITASVQDGVRAFQRWGSSSGRTFVRFDNIADARQVEAGLRDFVARRAAGGGENQEGKNPEDHLKLTLVAVPDMHFHDVSVHAEKPGQDRRVVLSLGAIGVLALAMAAINYVNLATARSDLRAREVALRKVAGATRGALVVQFLAEAVALVAFAALLGLAITELAVPVVNALGGWGIAIDYALVVPGLLALVLLLGLVAGFYPAMLLASYRPAQVLASARLPGGGQFGGRLRQALVLVQFAGAVAFGICTLVIDTQADFLRNADRGFQRDGLIIIRSLRASDLNDRQNSILDALRTVPGVVSVTKGNREPNSNSSSGTDVRIPGHVGPDPSMLYEIDGADYFQTYGVKLVAGRLFQTNRAVDDSAGPAAPSRIVTTQPGRTVSTVVNMSALPILGFASPQAALGRHFTLDGDPTLNVVGVVQDVRFMSPREPVSPEFYLYSSSPIADAQAAIRYNGATRAEMLDRLQAAWRRIVPDEPFVAQTADERLAEFYKPDQQHARLFSGGALLAIAIACIGLYGLAAFSTTRRVREIGIRKTLGASTQDLLLLLVGQFTRPVLLANVVAWPLAWAAMRAWLSGFDERIALSPLYFVAASLAALALSTLTVAGQAWRVARAEPARALRYE